MQKTVETLAWDPMMSVGQARLDYDHKCFIGFLNELRAHADADVHSEFMSDFLDKFMRYVARHFAEEEHYMASIGYPGTAAHVLAHQAAVEELTQVFELTIRGEPAAVPRLIDFMGRAHAEHFEQEDRKLADFVRSRGRPLPLAGGAG